MVELTRLRERLIPLPKQISLQGSCRIPSGDIRLANAFQACGMADNAMAMLERHMGNNSDGPFEIRLSPAGSLSEGNLKETLATVPNPEQAYAIHSAESGITIAANSGEGAFNGVRTLLQIMDISRDGQMEIPIVTIQDWPDIAFRGQWSDEIHDTVMDDLEWLSQWKLNEIDYMPEMELDADRKIRMKPASVGKIRRAQKQGMHVTPIIPHLEQLTIAFPALFSQADLKEMANIPSAEVANRCDYRPGLCMSSERVTSFLRDWMLALAEEKSVDNIQVWLSEDASPCYCPDCQGKNPYVLETACVIRAFRESQKRYPHITLELLLTQGSYPVNEQLCAMVPDDVRMTYYHGSKTYVSSHEPMIYEGLEPFLKKGGKLGVYPQVTHSWRTVFPWSGADFVRYRCQEFAQKGLSKVIGFAPPANCYHRMNLMAMAEWLWNSSGRNEEESIRAYACQNQMDPDALVRWAELEREPAWKLAESCVLQNMIYRYDVVLRKPSGFPGDLIAPTSLPPVDHVQELIQKAEHAAAIAKEAGFFSEEAESLCVAHAFSCYQLFTDCLERPDGTNWQRLAERADALYWSLMKWDMSVRPPHSQMPHLLMDTATVMLRAADYIRCHAAKQDSCTNGLYESHFLGTWDERVFDGKKAALTYDVTHLMQEAGTCHACFDFDFENSSAGTDIQCLTILEETPQGERTILSSTEPGRLLKIWEPWCEIALKADAVHPDGKRYLTINLELHSNEDAACRGMVSFRRV